MNAIEYIKDKLTSLHKSFPKTAIKYKKSLFSDTHLIQILPSKEFNGNENLQNAMFELLEDFENQFPYEIFGFVSDDTLNNFADCIFQLPITVGFIFETTKNMVDSKVYTIGQHACYGQENYAYAA